MMQKWFNYSIFTKKYEDASKLNKVVYLMNHRSEADFFIDHQLTNCTGSTISRLFVGIAAPLLGLCTTVCNIVWFFNREGVKDKVKFFKWINKKHKKNFMPGLIVYPEGTRCSGDQINPLKIGFIKYAYDYDLPIQIIITKNKENVVSGKTCTANRNVKLYSLYSKIYYPDKKKFESDQVFFNFIKNEWAKLWKEVYVKFNKNDYKENKNSMLNTKQSSILNKSKKMDPMRKVGIFVYYLLFDILTLLFVFLIMNTFFFRL